MSNSKAKAVTTENEVTVSQIDPCAFIRAYKKLRIKPIRSGLMMPFPDSTREVAYWVFDKTLDVVAALADWEKRDSKDVDTFDFREEQLGCRREKAELERKR